MADENAVDSAAQEGIDAQAGQGEPVDTATETPTEGVAESAAETTPEAQEGNDAKDAEAKDESTIVDSKEGEDDAEGEASEFYFAGERVQVEVPDDLRSSLSESGIDVDAVVSELYGKDSNFELSDETKQKLYAVYPPAIVDSYLSAIKAQNDRALQDYTATQESAKAQAEQASQWAAQEMGGQEVWDSVQSWLETDTDAVSDDEIAGFNAAMASGNSYLQKLAIQHMKTKYQSANGDGAGIALVEGNGAVTGGEAPLSRDGYIQAVAQELKGLRGAELAEKQAELDRRRRAGMAKGI